MDETRIAYRQGTIADKEQLQKLRLLSFGQYESALTADNWTILKSRLTDDSRYTDLFNTAQAFVCEYDNKIIGMAFLVPHGNTTEVFQSDWAYIRMLGVDPLYGGRGIAKNLTTICIDHAVQAGEKTIALHTAEFMDAARHIYESIGFKKVHEIAPQFGKRYWLYTLDLT